MRGGAVLEQSLQGQGRAQVDALAAKERMGLAEHPGIGIRRPSPGLPEVREASGRPHARGVVEGGGAEPHGLFGVARKEYGGRRVAVGLAPLRVVLRMAHRPLEVRAHGGTGRLLGLVASKQELDVEAAREGEACPRGPVRDRADRPEHEHLRPRERGGGVGDRHRARVLGHRAVPALRVDGSSVVDAEGEDARDAEHAAPARHVEGARPDGDDAGGDDDGAFVIHGWVGSMAAHSQCVRVRTSCPFA